MKKRIEVLIIAVCMYLSVFCPNVTIFAASGKTSVSVSASSVNIGDTVTVTGKASGASGEKVLATMTLSWDAGVLQFVSCSVDSNGGGGSRMVNGDSFTITLKAISAGTSSISLSAADGVLFDTVESLDSMAGSSTAVTVNNAAGQNTSGENANQNTQGGASGGNANQNTQGGVLGENANQDTQGSTSGGNANQDTQGGTSDNKDVQEENADTGKKLSGDNSLKSLTISPGTLSPSFSWNKTSYTTTVENDVTSIAVSAIPANAGASVESVTGNENLKEGTNTIKIVVKAENGVTAAYTIKVTKQAAGSSLPEEPEEDKTETETETETEAGLPYSEDGIQVNGLAYRISENFAQEDIPADFTEGTVYYHQNTYSGVSFTKGLLNLLWMLPEDGADTENSQGRFFVYDETRDSVYPFVKFTNGEKYVIALSAPVDFTMSDNYQQTSLILTDTDSVTAYQKISEDESEIASDFYVFYGVNHEGTEGWYQYDALEGTYQRFSGKMTDEGTEESNTALAALQEDYNALLQQYEEAKASSKIAMAILACVAGVLILIMVNLLVYKFRKRRTAGLEDDDFMDDDFVDDDFADDKFAEADRDSWMNAVSSAADKWTEDKAAAEGDAVIQDELFEKTDVSMQDEFVCEEDAADIEQDENSDNQRQKVSLKPLPEDKAAAESDELEVIDFNDL